MNCFIKFYSLNKSHQNIFSVVPLHNLAENSNVQLFYAAKFNFALVHANCVEFISQIWSQLSLSSEGLGMKVSRSVADTCHT